MHDVGAGDIWLPLTLKQRAFVADTASSAALLSGGFGAGKTYTLCRKLIVLAAENPGHHVGVVGPTWRQMKRDILRFLPAMLDHLGAKWRYWRQDQEIHVPDWGWYFDLCSAEDPRTLVGVNWAAAVVNEPGNMSEDAWRNIYSRVREKSARLLQIALAGTPEGYGWSWLYKAFAGEPRAGHRVTYISTEENPGHRPEHVEMMRRSLSPALALAYIEGRFVNVTEGRAYYEFVETDHVRGDVVASPDLRFAVALDFNVNPFAAVLLQQDGDETRAIDEITLHHGNTRAMARAIKAAIAPQHPGDTVIYPDPSGRARKTSSGLEDIPESDLSILADEGFTDIRLPQSRSIKDRINAFNSRLRNAFGDVRFLMSPRCMDLIADCNSVCWTADGKDLDKRDPMRTHWSDGVGYYFATEFPTSITRPGWASV